jgi:hypothetical protein
MRLAVLACALLVAVLAGCGDDDKQSDGSGKDGSDAPAAATLAKPDLVACLTEAGLVAKDSDVVYPEALIERDRIVETVEIAGTGDLTGLGDATYYQDEEAAVAGDQAGELVSTDDVRRGVAGRIAWRWAGEGAAADLIQDCLAG